MSVIIVGHAHLALMIMTVRWAWRLRPSSLTVDVHPSWATALLVAAGVACVPGVILFALPPILVGITGLLFVPALFAITARRIQTERMKLAMLAG